MRGRAPSSPASRRRARARRVIGAAALLFAGAAAAAPCESEITTLGGDTALAERIAAADPESRGRLRELMEAARILSEAGREEACRSVVSAVAEMTAEPPTAPVPEGAASRQPRPSEAAPAQDTANERLARASADERWDWREFDYASSADRARPFESVAERLSSEMIVGAEARFEGGEELGSVEGFLTDRVGVSHLIVSYGGFLGLGDREVAVPIGDVGFDPVTGVFFIDAGPAWLEEQPDWEQAEWSDEPDAWIRED